MANAGVQGGTAITSGFQAFWGPITYVASGAYASAGTSPVTLAKPAGVIDGDLLLAFFTVQQGSAQTDAAVTPPAGWTHIADAGFTLATAGNHTKIFTYYKVASAEGANYSFAFTATTLSGGDGKIRAYRGTAQTSPINGIVSVVGTNLATTMVLPTLVGSETFVSGERYVTCAIDLNNNVVLSASPVLSNTTTDAGAFESYSLGDLTKGSAPTAETLTFNASSTVGLAIGFTIIPPGSTTAWAATATLAGAGALIALPVFGRSIMSALLAGNTTFYSRYTGPYPMAATLAGSGFFKATPVPITFFETYSLTGELAAIGPMGGNALASAPRGHLPIVATLAGASTMFALSRVAGQISALLAGSSTLTSSPFLGLRAFAILAAVPGVGPGGGAMIANTRQTMQAGTTVFAGSTTLTALPFSGLTANALLAGASTLTALPFSGLRATATLAGASALIATTLQTMQVSALLAGSSTLSAVTSLAMQASALLAGSSTLTALPIMTMQVSALLAGATTLAATPFSGLTANALLAGSSTLSAVTSLALTANALLAASSTLTALWSVATNAFQITATLAGSSTLTATPIMAMQVSALLAGAGTLAVTSSLGLTANALLAGASTLSAITSLALTANALLAGSSTLTVTTLQALAALATLAGSSTLSANNTTLRMVAFATLAGASTLSAVLAGSLQAVATLAGSSTLSAAPIQTMQVSALLAGAGTLQLVSSVAWMATALLAGSSTLTAATLQTMRASATLAGASTLSAVTSLALRANALLAGSGALIATTSLGLTANALLAGSSTLTAVTSLGLTANALLVASSTLSATYLSKIQFITATLAGGSTLSATTAMAMQISAILAASSALFADGTVIPFVPPGGAFPLSYISASYIMGNVGGGGGGTPANAYVAEDGTTAYVAEDGVTFYVQESAVTAWMAAATLVGSSASSMTALALPPGVTLQAIDGETLTSPLTMSLSYFSRQKSTPADTFTFATSKATYSFSLDDPTMTLVRVINAINDTTTNANGTDVAVAQSLLIQVSIDVGSGIVASNQPGYGIMAVPGGMGTGGGTPDQAIGAWTIGLHMDETNDIPGQIVAIANATQDHRFWDYTGTWQNLNGGNINGVGMSSVLAAGQYPTPTGANRSIDIYSVDFYFFAGSSAAQQQNNMSSMLSVTVTADQMSRACHYGNMVDVFRAWSNGFGGAARDLTAGAQPTARLPFASLPENTDGLLGDAGKRLITPQEYNWACWAAFIHGARFIYPFYCCRPQSTNFNGYDNITSVGGITMLNQGIATHTLAQQLAPVLNSPFALGFLTAVSPHGYLFPVYETNWFNGGIEACVHWYQGGNVTNQGLALVNGFYIIATTRDSETATNISATFTVASGSVANVVGESRSISIVAGQFTDTFASAWTVHIYQIS